MVGHNHVETVYPESQTVPSQSYTVKQLIELNKKGISPAVMKQALWEMDEFGEEQNPLRAKNFDLTDMDAIIRTVKTFQTKVENDRKKQKLEERRKERESIIKEYLAEKDKDNNGVLDPKSESSNEGGGN